MARDPPLCYLECTSGIAPNTQLTPCPTSNRQVINAISPFSAAHRSTYRGIEFARAGGLAVIEEFPALKLQYLDIKHIIGVWCKYAMPVATAGIKTTNSWYYHNSWCYHDNSQHHKDGARAVFFFTIHPMNGSMESFSKVATYPSGSRFLLGACTLTNKPVYPLSVRLSSTRSTAVRPVAIRPRLDDSTNSNAQAYRQSYPLSIVPTRDLLRSLLISTISSNSFLLTAALNTLSFLCKPFGGPLLDVDRNPVLRKILKTTFYDQFCAGENPTETKLCAQRLKDLGFEAIILTYGKESLHDDGANTAKQGVGLDPEIANWKMGIMETINSIGSGDYIAFK